MKLKKFVACMIALIFAMGIVSSNFAEPTEDFHVEPETEPTEEANGPALEEYFEYKDDTGPVSPGSQSGDVDMGTIGRGLYYDGTDFYFFLDTGVMATNFMYNIEGDRFFFGEDGKMVKDQLIEFNDEIYYFDVNGAMFKNRWYTSEEVDLSDNTITYTDYYFGPTGRAYRALVGGNGMIVKTIEGFKYGFNADGEKLVGYYDQNGEKRDPDEEPAFMDCVYYFDPQDDGAAVTGWHYYEGAQRGNLYDDNEEIVLYFDEKTCKKVAAKVSYSDSTRCVSRIIDGQRYMFDQYGVRKNRFYVNEPGRGTQSNAKFYSEELDGYLQKGWFMAVPGSFKANGSDLILEVNRKKHDSDEEVWFYATGTGNILRKTIRKIGNYVYAFDDDGVMQQDAFVRVRNGSFIKAYSTDELYKANVLLDPAEYGGCGDPYPEGPQDPVDLDRKKGILKVNEGEQWMYFQGEMSGEAKTGAMVKGNTEVKVELNDEDIYFLSNNTGGYVMREQNANAYSTVVKRGGRLIQNGVVLRPNIDDNNYGIVRLKAAPITYAANVYLNYKNQMVPKNPVPESENVFQFVVVNSSGAQVTSTNKAIKDKQGNYFYVGNNGKFLGYYTVQGKYYDKTPNNIKDADGNDVPASDKPCWVHKRTDEKHWTIGMPAEEFTADCDDYFLNFTRDSIIAGNAGEFSPFKNGAAKFIYEDGNNQ